MNEQDEYLINMSRNIDSSSMSRCKRNETERAVCLLTCNVEWMNERKEKKFVRSRNELTKVVFVFYRDRKSYDIVQRVFVRTVACVQMHVWQFKSNR